MKKKTKKVKEAPKQEVKTVYIPSLGTTKKV
jgi:hypothetical protein